MRELSEDREEARKKALQLLEYCDRTVNGLSDRLRQAGFSAEAAADAVEYAVSYGYVDDRRYAAGYIRSHLRQCGRKKILMDLMQKGVDRRTAEEIYEEVAEEEGLEETELIRTAIRRRFGETLPENPSELKKIYGYLARRGFSYEDIRTVLETDFVFGIEGAEITKSSPKK